MSPKIMRAVRMIAVFLAVFAVMVLRFTSGLVRGTEADRAAPWAFLTIATLIGVGAWAMEVSGSGTAGRRDSFWGLAAALLGFSILKLAGLL